MFPTTRMRRLRHIPQLRDLVRQTELSVNDLVQPLFIHHGSNIKNPIASMPGQYQISLDYLEEELANLVNLGIKGVLLFGLPEAKDAKGSDACSDQGIIAQAIRRAKSLTDELVIMVDTCFCEYTDHGHCGVLKTIGDRTDIDNDVTLKLLAEQAVVQAQEGADVIAPSGNIDGMVLAIREGLDEAGFSHVPILSYAAKYASSFYGPFREAVDSVPQFGDRRSYQMDPANGDEALRECELDVLEGADMLMVKPAMAYLDIIYQVKQNNPGIPLAAYRVSGEYAMVKAAAEKGWIDEERVTLEGLTAIKRAGADFIICYSAKNVAGWL